LKKKKEKKEKEGIREARIEEKREGETVAASGVLSDLREGEEDYWWKKREKRKWEGSGKVMRTGRKRGES